MNVKGWTVRVAEICSVIASKSLKGIKNLKEKRKMLGSEDRRIYWNRQK
jgi:hypothetical protein